MSVQVSYKKQFVLGIFLLLLLLLVLEGILRTYENIIPQCSYIGRDAFQSVDITIQKQICLDGNALNTYYDPILYYYPEQHFTTININSYGFRGDGITKEKPSNVYRIIIVGGSTAFGYGSTSDKTTIAGFLENEFTNEHPDLKVEVINAGTASYASTQEQFLIRNKLLNFDPDLIIVYDGWNDSRFYYLPPTDKKIKTEPTSLFTQLILQIHGYRTPFILAKVAGLGWDPERDYIKDKSLDQETTDKSIQAWKNSWVEICNLGKKHGFSTLIIVQPILGTGKKPLSPDEATLYPNSEYEEGILNMMNGLAESLNELNHHCSGVADLRNVFDGISEPIYFDQGHINDLGNKIVAQRMYEITLPIVLYDISK